MRKIAVFTGSRAEYGLLYWIIKSLYGHEEAELQLVVGGMHLSTEFGYTVKDIENDGFPISEKLEFLLSSDTAVGISKSMGLALISASEFFYRKTPDLLVVLGDRFESMAICQAAMLAQIPIAHIHGGEITEGLIDEAVRHSITKMAHIHFTATEIYRDRVIQMGERPSSVFNFGAPGLDSIKFLPLLSRVELSGAIDLDVTSSPYFVVTYHPVTLSRDGEREGFVELINALELRISEFKYIITYPNSDTHGRAFINILENFRERFPERVLLVKSLGQLKYLSSLKHSQGVIGNSSSGLIEAPTFSVPTINIGERQGGRVMCDSVICCDATEDCISKAITKSQTESFMQKCVSSINPYGVGNTSEKIVSTLMEYSLDDILVKKFHDIKVL